MGAELVFVSGLADAPGARGAAAALACAASTSDQAALLIDVGGPHPRPTLLSSRAAAELETTLTAILPDRPSAARGQVCHLALSTAVEDLAAVGEVRANLQHGYIILHLPDELLPTALATDTLRPSGVLIRADTHHDREIAAKTVRRAARAHIPIAILDHRLDWVTERRALFGALPDSAPGGLPVEVLKRLLPTLAT